MSKLKKLLVASLCVALVGAVAVPVTDAIVKASNTLEWSEVNFEEKYVVGDTVNIPERTLDKGGETYSTSITLTYPDGTTTSIQSGDLKLSMAGNYEVKYATGKDAGRLSETESFFVADQLWSVNSSKSSYSYGKVGQKDALLVRLAPGDTLTFNQIIDLKNYDKDSVTNPLFQGFINPDSVGSNDFSSLIIKFTDVYDPTQVLTVRAHKSTGSVNANCLSYWTAAGTGQTLAGFEGDNWRVVGSRDDGICGTPRNVSFCSQKGTWIASSLPYELTTVTADTESFTIIFDQETTTVSVEDRSNVKKIADLDDPVYYTSEPLWSGFTSSEVFVSVMAESYAAETANFAVSKLLGYDFSADNQFEEDVAPEITVNVDDKYVEYDSNGEGHFKPLAIVGGNYPVPTATAYDAYSGNVKVETKVYANYTSSNPDPVSISKDGTFKVDKETKYAIVYTAKDNMGNTATCTYWITTVTNFENPLALTVNEAGAVKDGVCGVAVPLAPYATTGGSGDVTVTITASCGDTTLDVSNGELLAEKAGTWTITYVAKDYAGITKTASYEMDIEWGSEPVFLGTPVLPKYFISGMTYVVPTFYAYDYSTGVKVQKTASLVVEDANGTNTYAAGQKYTPVVNATSGLKIFFKCDNVIIPVQVTAVTPLAKLEGVDIINLEDMFVGEGFSRNNNENGLALTATSNKDFTWTFANALAAEGSSIIVKGVKGYSAFSGYEVTFTDYANSNISVTMKLRHDESGWAVVDFGNVNRTINKGFNKGNDDKGKPLDEFTFSYKFGAFYVDSIAVKVSVTDNGEAFEGFPSGKVYVSAKAVGVKAGQKYLVKGIDNHVIVKNIFDTTAPKISITGNYGGMKNYNSNYVITPAIASDVIDPNVSCTVTVKMPNGTIAYDIEGKKLQNVPADAYYTIKLSEYGQYQVTYSSKDWSGITGTEKYAVNVLDRKAPQAKILGELKTSVNVEDTVILPEVEISDDSSPISEMKVYRMVRNPFDVLTVIGYDVSSARYSFTFKNEGDYKFIIIVYDAAGNQTVLDYVVTVTKGE